MSEAYDEQYAPSDGGGVRRDTGASKTYYRSTLAGIACGAYYRDGEKPAFPPYMEDAAEAVAAQVLRDVMALMREREVVAGGFALTVPTITDDDLMNFAADRGIDLESGEG